MEIYFLLEDVAKDVCFILSYIYTPAALHWRASIWSMHILFGALDSNNFHTFICVLLSANIILFSLRKLSREVKINTY